ncbi:MAG TPA: DUF177 domain-containing protein [Acidimicrobiales bacterium]|jgi:uncharacterized protein|nr:DUF177 domain-containing protein [Acidimicrobiales bacterium]
MAPAADPFIVHVARLRRSGTSTHEVRSGPVELAGPLHEEGIDPGRSVVPVGAEAQVDVMVHPFSGGYEAVGTVDAPWEGICRRCTLPVAGWLHLNVHERFGVGAGDEDEMYPVTDDTIDLGPMVRDSIVLELPMAPLCREDCKGLCPQCGADRNEGECGCVAPTDPRWANLDVLR